MTDIEDDQPARSRAERRQDRSRSSRRRAGRPTAPAPSASIATSEAALAPVPSSDLVATEASDEPPTEPGLSRRERRELRDAQGRRKHRHPAPVERTVSIDPAVMAPTVMPPIEEAPPVAEAAVAVAPPVAEAAIEEAPPAEETPDAADDAPPLTRRERRLAASAPPIPAPTPVRARRPPVPRSAQPAPSRIDRRFWTRVVPLIAACLGLLVAVGAVMRAADDGRARQRAAPPAPTSAESKPLLLVHHSPTFGNDLIVLVGRNANRGSVLMIPSATQLDIPSLGVATLSAVPVNDNGAGLANSVENVVGVGIGKTAVLDDAGLTAVLGPAAPVPVTLTNPVEISGTGTRFDAGAQRLPAAQASELMSGPQTVNELDRLVTASAVIDGWLIRLKDPSVAKGTAGLSGDLAALVATATAPDSYRIDTLPVDSIPAGGGERFGVRGPELERYVSRSFSEYRLGTGPRRPRVEVLNGTGFLGVAQALSQAVVPAGGRVTLTGNVPGFGVPTTQVVYYKDSWRAEAQHLLDAMGCGSLRKASRDLGIADVTIVVGLDCPQYGVPGGNS